ncbi:MAG: hypothetical protein ACKOC8_10520 [Pirellulales bacterium]
MPPLQPAKAEASRPPEVWLRGNARPAIGLLAAMLILASLAVAAVVAAEPLSWGAWGAAAGAIAAVAAAAGLAWAAALPRLVRRGAVLDVRLSPLAIHRVPLEVVECVFPGSQPLGGDGAEHDATRRVSTLVLRLAERAVDWRSRPVAAAWGAWEDGSIVFDGRWCEPLSAHLAREISARLLEARREVAMPGTSP